MATPKVQPVRGTQDLLGQELQRHRHIVRVTEGLAQRYGYAPIETPLFESTNVFKRTLGETSDVVGKEMYTFLDRGGEEITLRPEGTAGVVRAVITEGLTQSMPLKFIYAGAMMRYERPQKGRRRQFHQVGVEFLGAAHPLADVETIALGYEVLKALAVADRVALHINTLGDQVSRQRYKEALIAYFSAHKGELSADSLVRLDKNPLRILDSKESCDQEIVESAPVFSEYMTAESQVFFETVCTALTASGIPYIHNTRLVRGLDYYNHTAFEFLTTDLGAQGTVLAGGRYDGLMAQMGGPEVPGVGWALGIERLALMIDDVPLPICDVSVVPVGTDAPQSQAFQLAQHLREGGLSVDMLFSGAMGKRLKHADKIGAKFALIFGETEQQENQILVRCLTTSTQEKVDLSALLGYLKTKLFV